MEKSKEKKIAIVHDFLVQHGGAEKVLEIIAEMFPGAPIYTLLYDKNEMGSKFSDREIRTSFLQKFPKFLKKRYRFLLPFFIVVPEVFDLRDFDLVISSSGAWSKGIVTKLNTKHIAYIHSPMRFVWDYNEKYFKEKGVRPTLFKRIFMSYLRIWDYMAAQRPEFLIANSEYTKQRINKYYRRESTVIYPAVDIAAGIDQKNTNENEEKDFFLVVSRLSGYKKVDIIVEAFNKLGLPLIVVGKGEQYEKLKKIAGENIKILGWQNEDSLKKYYSSARAFVFIAEEDFGIAPVEAMKFGVPVVAFRSGGLLEIVEEGKTGEFFDAQTPEVLSDGIRRFMENEKSYDRIYIMEKASVFSKDRFKKELESFIRGIE